MAWTRQNLLKYLLSLSALFQLGHKVCSHCKIAIAVYLSQLMGCMGFSVIVEIAHCEQLYWYPTEPICCDWDNRNHYRFVWTAFKAVFRRTSGSTRGRIQRRRRGRCPCFESLGASPPPNTGCRTWTGSGLLQRSAPLSANAGTNPWCSRKWAPGTWAPSCGTSPRPGGDGNGKTCR